MALATYSDLKSTIADWLNRDDLTAVIPTFISLAESGIERVLRTVDMIATSDSTVDSEYHAVPTDMLEVRSMQITSAVPNKRVDFVTIDELSAMDSQDSGIPRYFTIVGSNFRFHPVPDGSYTARLVYYADLPKLSDSVTTNWLLTAAPDVYLYGALSQAAPYLKDDERTALWASLYTAAIQQLQTADERGATSGGVLKSRVTAFGRR